MCSVSPYHKRLKKLHFTFIGLFHYHFPIDQMPHEQINSTFHCYYSVLRRIHGEEMHQIIVKHNGIVPSIIQTDDYRRSGFEPSLFRFRHRPVIDSRSPIHAELDPIWTDLFQGKITEARACEMIFKAMKHYYQKSPGYNIVKI